MRALRIEVASGKSIVEAGLMLDAILITNRTRTEWELVVSLGHVMRGHFKTSDKTVAKHWAGLVQAGLGLRELKEIDEAYWATFM